MKLSRLFILKALVFLLTSCSLIDKNESKEKEDSKEFDYEINFEEGFYQEKVKIYLDYDLKYIDTLNTFRNLGFSRNYKINKKHNNISIKTSNDSINIKLAKDRYYGIRLLNDKLLYRSSNKYSDFTYE
jgi:hypothetical protein